MLAEKIDMRTKFSNKNKSRNKLWVWLWFYHVISVGFKQFLHRNPQHHEDSVGRVYPIFKSLFKHALTAYFCAIDFSCAFIPHLYPPSGDGKANLRLDQSTIIYIKALNIHSLNLEIWKYLFKPNDWVNYLWYIKETHIYTYQKNILCTSIFKTY